MKTVLEFGVRGGQFAESIILPSQALGAQMAANMVRVFSNNQQHTYADKKSNGKSEAICLVGLGQARLILLRCRFWTASHVGLLLQSFGRKTMSRSNVGNTKPHIFIHKGLWRVSRHVKPNPLWLWHKAHWQINQWNDGRHYANSSNTK